MYDYGRIKLAWGVTAADLKKLQPNTVLTVYHGTRIAHVFNLINGFDANKVRGRDYGGQRHAGLFVAPSERTAEKFASYGEIILEIKVRAKFLHGTDYSGNIGRHQRYDHQWIADKYPDSFRPYLTMTLLQSNEPQALLRGLVSPSQITRVRYKPHGQSAKWYSRKAFLDLGLEGYPEGESYGPKEKVRDLGWDLSNPNYSVDQMYEALADMVGKKDTYIQDWAEGLAKKDTEVAINWIKKLMERLGFGPTAVRAFVHRYRQYLDKMILKVALDYDYGRS